MGYLGIIENLTKKRMKGLKPPTAQEAFQAKKKVALKKIERDFADEAIRSNFDKFKGDGLNGNGFSRAISTSGIVSGSWTVKLKM